MQIDEDRDKDRDKDQLIPGVFVPLSLSVEQVSWAIRFPQYRLRERKEKQESHALARSGSLPEVEATPVLLRVPRHMTRHSGSRRRPAGHDMCTTK